MPRPTSAPRRTDSAPVSADVRLAGEEQGRLDALADDRREGQEREAPRPAGVERPVDGRLELALDAGSLAPHPEQHPGHDAGRDEHDRALEDLLVRLLEGADRRIDPEADHRAQGDRDPGADPDLAGVPAVPRPVEVGEDDADDERRLDAFAEAGQQPGRERPEVHGRCSPCSDRW